MKHFINTGEFSRRELERIIDNAIAREFGSLKGKSIALLFFNSSLRTRASFEVGIAQLGGHSTTLEVGGGVWNLEYREGAVMNADKPEHVKDAARVLSRYFDAVCVRSFPPFKSRDEDMADPVIEAFRKYSTVPIINMESCLYHPCQAMADIMTIKEKFGRTDGVKVVLAWAYHIKALPIAVPNSFAVAAKQFGCELTVVAPPGYGLPGFEVSHDRSLLAKADVVYAKSWGSLEQYGQAPSADLKNWIVDLKSIGKAKFMHCMPLRRNVEIADDVLDSPGNLIYDEAENRLHVQKAILSEVFQGFKVS